MNEFDDAELRLYLKEIEGTPLLSADDEKRLGRLVRSGDAAARDRMIRANLRLVISIAKDYRNRGIAFMDLIEEGNCGLIKAVERFDPEEGSRFSTYATWWIKQTIRRAIANSVKPVRIPTYMTELIRRYHQARVRIEHGRGGSPADLYEVADAMSLKPEAVEMLRRALGATQQPRGLEVEDEHGSSIRDSLADENCVSPLDAVLTRDEIRSIDNLLNVINQREADILRKRYGIGADQALTLKEIGDGLGLTRERVRQIENEALRKLHFAMMQLHGGQDGELEA